MPNSESINAPQTREEQAQAAADTGAENAQATRAAALIAAASFHASENVSASRVIATALAFEPYIDGTYAVEEVQA